MRVPRFVSTGLGLMALCVAALLGGPLQGPPASPATGTTAAPALEATLQSAAPTSALQGSAAVPVSALGDVQLTNEAEEDESSGSFSLHSHPGSQGLVSPQQARSTGSDAARPARSCALLCVFLC